jgi:hypothetical protein
MDAVEALLPYRNATKTFLPIFDLKKNFILQNINQSSLTIPATSAVDER